MTERRAKGKLVTVIAGLGREANDLNELAARLKNACGAGGTVKDGRIELQGDHLQAAQTALQEIGYKTKAGRG
jgi:translation initiation factor 1